MNSKDRIELIKEKVSNVYVTALNAQVKGVEDAIVNGKPSKTADRVLYITGEITSGGNMDLFEVIKDKAVGVTNFDKKTLVKGRNGVALGVSLQYGTLVKADYSGDFESTVPYCGFDEKAPAYVRNANLSFEDDEKPLIVFDVAEIHNPNNSTRSNDETYRSLGDTRLLEAERQFQCHLKFPSVNPNLDATKRHFVKIRIRVGETVKR